MALIGTAASRIALEYGDRFTVKGRGFIGLLLTGREAGFLGVFRVVTLAAAT